MNFEKTISFKLPWPNPKLNPNQSKGMHWGVTAALRKNARVGAATIARAAAGAPAPQFGQAIPLTITFQQPDRRARDRDNLLAALKPALDGVADALGINDSQFDPVIIRREYGARPGAVQIEIGGVL